MLRSVGQRTWTRARVPGDTRPAPWIKSRHASAEVSQVEWVQGAVVVLVVVLVAWLPGMCLVRSWGAPAGLLSALVAAPPLTLGVAALAAMVCGALGIRWGVLPLAAGTALACAPG